jgi:hypothetical protein
MELVLPELTGAGDRLLAHPRIGDLYSDYLVAMHSIIRASVPLMDAARERALTMDESDVVAAALADYLGTHIGEEMHHDDWLLRDLEILGHKPAGVLARIPSPAVAGLVGSQYYWIFHVHPVALLGYIAVLEGYPPSMSLINDLIARTGHPRKAFRTLIAHSGLDPGHRDDLDAALDKLPLTREQEALVGLSAISTIHMLAGILDEVVRRVPVSAPRSTPSAQVPTGC